MGGCQNYGPFLGTLNHRCRTITGIQKGTIILTTTHISGSSRRDCGGVGGHGLRWRQQRWSVGAPAIRAGVIVVELRYR